ncbi:MAG: hypothetical protein LJE84_03615 [Gammaproteobacteria bacterium]|nr:hypothetical protein [Gammaproteobacteria bacterium]
MRRLLLLVLLCLPGFAAAGKWSGNLALEGRLFFDQPTDPVQHGDNLSLSFEPQYYQGWDNGRQSFTLVPFVRLDQGDNKRSHADIRELTWLKASDGWELRAGIRRVFWGVTEAVHLVDIINQTDQVENLDGEDKLGQPMLNLALIRDWGTLDLFVLPGFRERSFPGREGRVRLNPVVDPDQAVFESGDGNHHVDFAARWGKTLGNWDVGVSHFSGTSRDPGFIPGNNATGEPVLIPVYPLIDQTGLELQFTGETWLWKLEAIRRRGQGQTYLAATGGFEYSFYGVFGSAADLGVIGELIWDERGGDAPTPFARDLLTGFRLALNDVQSSELLVGAITDLDDGSVFLNIEASRRLGSNYKASLELRGFPNLDADAPLGPFRKDGHLRLELARYF